MDKKENKNKLTHSAINHLMAIHHLREAKGYARSIDIARYLDISRGSASITLHKIMDKGFIQEDENKFLYLTESGQDIVRSILRKRDIAETFFREMLGFDKEESLREAHKVEHLLSEETGDRLTTFMGFFLSERKEIRELWQKFTEFKKRCHPDLSCSECEEECFFNSDHNRKA